MTPGRVLIVGAGLAGSRCAETLRAEGFEGAVLLVGEEPHPPYERPALSKEFLAGAATRSASDPRAFWRDKGVELRARHARPSRRTRSPASPRPMPGRFRGTRSCSRRVRGRGGSPAFDGRSGVHVLRTLADAESLRAAIVPDAGSPSSEQGSSAAEVASTARELGVEVTILEARALRSSRVLGAEVGRVLAERYREHGVDLRLGAQVERLAEGPDGALRALALADGTEVPCDAVLVAVGAEPAGELVGGDAIRTDACGRTEPARRLRLRRRRRVWRPSLGGHARMEHWTSAAAQGAAVARAILGRA